MCQKKIRKESVKPFMEEIKYQQVIIDGLLLILKNRKLSEKQKQREEIEKIFKEE